MQHRHVGVRSLLPTDENPAESIHPAMSALDHPTTSFEAGLLLDGLRFFAATTDVRGEGELDRELPNLAIDLFNRAGRGWKVQYA